ncbi:cytochrome C biogenesis protein [Flavobacterium psychrophilum]|nr:cytochrome C biogenesis protein [Flavobacterium psychrophilum]
MEKLKSILFSTRLMAILFLGFAIAMATGTFIESKYNTTTARILVYNAWWFEGIMLVFVLNFAGNIKRYQLLKKEKWATLMLHLSFIFIIIGAGITRYISYEGMMPIREGASENHFYSDKTFLSLNVDGEYKGEMKRRTFEQPVLFSQATNNHFSINENFDKTPFTIQLKKFIMGAKETIIENKNGIDFLKMVESGGGSRHEHFLKSGEVVNIHNVLFSLNKFTKGAININTTLGAYTISAPFEGEFMRMADKLQGKVAKDATQPLMMRSLYNVGGAQFVFPEPAKKGTIGYESSNNYKAKEEDDALVLIIKSAGQEREVTLVGSKGKMGEPKVVKIGKLDYTLSYGSKSYELPFKIKLNDFAAQKYPGTEKSYSSYESSVTVEDKPNFDYKIFMNHVLDYKGYRFFQSSFDPDEKGTVLSVSHDFWGTWITYLGYFMLFFALMAIMFTKDSRFADIKRKLELVKIKKANLTILFLLFGLSGFAQNHQEKKITQKQIDSVLDKRKISEKHAEKFGRLIVQDLGGRMKPINTFSSELLRKVSHSDTYQNMNSDQVFVSMTQYPTVWYEVPLIYIREGNDSIRSIIGIDKKQKLAKFIDFFDEKGNYKLSKYLDAAYKAANPNNFEKGFVETDKKINLMNSALSGSILKIFPIPNDENNKWASYAELNHVALKGMDSVFTKQILPIYLMSLETAAANNNYKESDFYLDGIVKFQKKHGSKVMPSEEKITSEILYNKYNILQKLFNYYSLSSILMLIFTLLSIFFDKKWLRITVDTFHVFIGFLFGMHTLALAARWFISGHAPWSNAYESIIYVAWATMFFGLAFDKKSKLTVASAAFVTAMIFMQANANWIDPEIANLQPVLNSYWLMIHVAVIVGSYGPFALGMILGFVSLVLMFFTNEKTKLK